MIKVRLWAGLLGVLLFTAPDGGTLRIEQSNIIGWQQAPTDVGYNKAGKTVLYTTAGFALLIKESPEFVDQKMEGTK